MKVGLITGSNRGLGMAVAKQLLADNMHVIITARDSKKLEEAQNYLKSIYKPELVHGFLCDVSNNESVLLLKARLEKAFDHIDLLVNNAGIIVNQNGFAESSLEELETTLNTNLYGSYRVSKACLMLLQKSSGAMVINVSSGMGAHAEGGTGYTAYRLSKFALNGMTEIMNRELEPKKIKVVSVCPGWVHTDLGGSNAPRTPEIGARSILLPYVEDLEGGKFYRDGQTIGW